jgi:hypothetical protein
LQNEQIRIGCNSYEKVKTFKIIIIIFQSAYKGSESSETLTAEHKRKEKLYFMIFRENQLLKHVLKAWHIYEIENAWVCAGMKRDKS